MTCALWLLVAGHGTMGYAGATGGKRPLVQAKTKVSWSVTQKTNTFALGVMVAGGLLLAGCSSEIGRVPMLDTDITCLHKQMAGPMFLSFPLAANTCQRMSNGGFVLGEAKAKPLPLDLKGAPDLQKQADEYGYTYTR